MSLLQTVYAWFAANPLMAASLLFGGSIIVVTLHALLTDYAVIRRD